jgi:anti-anti-sigma factor
MIAHTVDRLSKTFVLTVRVDILSTVADEMLKAMLKAFGETADWQNLRMDLTGIKRIDSMGLNLIVTVLGEVRKRGGKMTIEVKEGAIYQAFLFTRLDRQVELVLR